MPVKLLRIVSSFGYTGDKAFGFDLVSKCIAGKGIRSPLGSLMFLAYYTILAGFAPSVLGETNIPIADKILKEALQDYKESAFFLYFQGRNSRLKGEIKESTAAFELASSKATVEWGSELQRLCDYELGLNCAISLEWSGAAMYFERLAKENYWSKVFFLYFKAASLEASGNKAEAVTIYQSIPGLVSRKFGGRTILVEQYVTRKVKLFEQTGFEDTNLPTLEILLIWNAFASMTPESLTTSLAQVDPQISKNRGNTSLDSLAVLKTIKGAILHQLGRHKEGAECLNWVIDLPAGKITEEKWVVPFACWEAGVGCWIEDKNLPGDKRWARAKAFWDKATGFSGYEFEFRLSIRIHAVMMRIKELS
ncbi:Tetratricopeptide repeat protein 39C [Dissophora globulifera]|uniref:Tetratricopeptide repeat protein 39C n=1 Tax=Dissophora globulifera TaxID=979702 RepID=A0A9P6R4J3_9FUNG|nr:Tetratricopeptide repeat protein 39C [Dissophora globulifera]